MADTKRTLSAILALMADNTAGDISAQDQRDFVVSSGFGHRTAVADADKTVDATDAFIAYSSLSAPRVVTLPAANAVNAGYVLTVGDESGSCSSTNTLTITRAGADTIDGATTEIIKSAYGFRVLISDGTSKWTFDKSLRRTARTPVADADKTVASSDRYIAYSSLSAARVITLPLANSVLPGYEIMVGDESGSCSLTNTLTITRAGSDTIDGATTNVIACPYGMRRLFSDGSSKWLIDGGVLRNSTGTAKGDIIAWSAANTPIRLAVGGTNGQVLQVASGETTGLKYAILGTTSVFPQYRMLADMLDTPNNADWTVNARAPLAVDSVNNAAKVRLFDDTAEEGVGFTCEIPTGATNIIFEIRGRAVTANASGTVILNVYRRQFTNNDVVTAWSGATALASRTVVLNNIYHIVATDTVALSTLSLTAGLLTQFEITRAPGDTKVGDWALLSIHVYFS